MGTLAKVGIFIIFLVVFGAYLFANKKLITYCTNNLFMHGKLVLAYELLAVSSLLSFFTFIWILSGFFNFTLILLLFGGYQVGLIVSWILSSLLGSPKPGWVHQIVWEGAQLPLRHKWLVVSMVAMGILIAVCYPIFAGIAYFSNVVPSPEGVLAIVRTTIIWILALGLVFALQMNTLILGSENIHEDTRSQYLISGIGQFITVSLWFSFAFWAFKIQSTGMEISLGEISLTVSPILMLLLLGYYLIGYMIPYVAGVKRGKVLRQTLGEIQLTWFRKITEVMKAPGDAAAYIDKIDAIRSEIRDDKEQFISQRPGLQLARQFDNIDDADDVPNEIQSIRDAYLHSRDMDPRIAYLENLRSLDDEAGQIIDTIEKAGDQKELDRSLAKYVNLYDGRQATMRQDLTSAEKSQPVLVVGILAIIGPIVSPVLGQVGKWATVILFGPIGE